MFMLGAADDGCAEKAFDGGIGDVFGVLSAECREVGVEFGRQCGAVEGYPKIFGCGVRLFPPPSLSEQDAA